MEQTQNQKSQKPKSTMKKLDPNSAKLLASLKERANKKEFGRKVRENEILAAALKLVRDEHLKELQNQTLSEKDRLHIKHMEYCKAKGKVSLDEFIGLLMRGELQINSQNQKEV